MYKDMRKGTRNLMMETKQGEKSYVIKEKYLDKLFNMK